MLPFRSGCSQIGGALLLLIFLVGLAATAAEPNETKGQGQKKGATPSEGTGNIPLAIGHEAKGIILPDYDLEGRLRGRFNAGIAKRIDDGHVQMRNLRMITFTPDEKPDLEIEMIDSVLDLKTRVLSSRQRTTVKRTDFQIAGDTMEFNTASREGTLVGNVKMVISGRAVFQPAASE